jgi:hypothetical protein
MKKLILITIGIILTSLSFAQDYTSYPEKVFRVMLINPGIEIELPVLNKSTLTTTLGVGFEGAYKNLVEGQSEPYYNYYSIAPFLDVRYKNIYNQKRRISEGLNVRYNTGNYWGGKVFVQIQRS